jgi:spore coat protein A
MGINRLNIYAGLFGSFIIRDSVEDALNLPSGKYEIPLVIQDRMFRKDGQLEYPTSGDPESPWISEFEGDAILVNGKLYPFLEVEPRKYRFRLLNASNSRFYNFSLSNDAAFHVIGSDQGLLGAPVELKSLALAPAERSDIVIDFAEHRGEQIVLRSGAFALMQFRVSPAKVTDSSSLPAVIRPVPRIPESAAVRTRVLSLDEYDDRAGNSILMLLNRTYWHMPVTENPTINSTEIWSFVNSTDDSHPIHLHLVRFQILDRRQIEPFAFQSKREIHYLAPAMPPDPSEAGWKDTVRADPGMVTRIIVRFEGITGRYVWHCHILEHEDNEMMRPYEVVAST